MRIPDKVANFRVYKDSKFLFAADIELPSIEYMSEKLSGGGIAGELETPTIGQTSSMTTKLNLRTPCADIAEFLEPKGTHLMARGAIQRYDSAGAELGVYGCLISMKILPKTLDLGKFEVGSPSDTSIEGEVSYLKILIDNEEICEIDKMNFVCRINGKDYLEEMRSILGM